MSDWTPRTAARPLGVFRYVDAVNGDGAAHRLDKSGDHAQGGGLARAVGAEQPGYLAVRALEAHSVDGLDFAVVFLEVFYL